MRIRVLSLIVGLSLVAGFACDSKKEKASADEAEKKESAQKEKSADKEGAAKAESGESGEMKGEKKGAEKGDMTCKSVATNVVNVMVDELGDKSMIQKDDIPKLAGGCEETNGLEKNPKAAKCMSEAKSQEDLKNCEGANKLMKTWITKSGGGK